MKIGSYLPTVTLFLLSTALVGMSSAQGGPPPPPTVPCGPCMQQPESSQLDYAIDPLGTCPAEAPKRKVVRLTEKYTCLQGVYYRCEESSTMICAAYKPRPACPADTCQK